MFCESIANERDRHVEVVNKKCVNKCRASLLWRNNIQRVKVSPNWRT